MANSASHASLLGLLGGPVINTRATIGVPYLDADGDPTDPTTPDTEFSVDGGAFADCAEEVTTITGANGQGFITLSGAETNGSIVQIAAKVASGPKNTLAVLYPVRLPILESGTAQAGAAGTITLAAGAAAYDLTGCIVRTTGGTGGGGTGGANNQARLITAYNTSTKVATILPSWETTPDSTTTYDILVSPLAPNAVAGRFLRPTTDGRTLDVEATGEAGINLDNTVGTLDAAEIGTGAITAAKFAAGAIDAAAIGTGAIDADAIAAAAITAAKFGAGAIDAAAIGTGAIDADALAADAVDEIWDEAMVEQAQGIPGATPAFRTVLAYLYMALRNRLQITSTNKSFTNDALTVIWKKALSDDGTTYQEEEGVSGP